MKPSRFFLIAVLLSSTGLVCSEPSAAQTQLPYAEAGWTEQEAAAHLLRRFTFGPRPGEVDRVVEMGLEAWLTQQLDASLPANRQLARRLGQLPAWQMTGAEMATTFLNPGQLRNRLVAEGRMTRAAYDALSREAAQDTLNKYRQEKGYEPLQRLIGQLMAQKLLHARYSENQLEQVLVDFWYNHFNVALQDASTRAHLLSYERDAIRPHILGNFRDMLEATAKHPAMLLYLDNTQSTSPEGTLTTASYRRQVLQNRRPTVRSRPPNNGMQNGNAGGGQRGINENYARELLELHTLGVDGGYTQADVENVARAFSGWSYLPPEAENSVIRERMMQLGTRLGVVMEETFVFRANLHDATEKQILGHDFPEGGGIEEGLRVLDLLSEHPSTARHLARKLAVRFVSDDPPQALVDDLAAVYLAEKGNLRAMTQALAYHPAFWEKEAVLAKVKSPFELTVSALRALDAQIGQPRALLEALNKMGQPLYAYQAPTGYPDRADAWINAGALLNRMNFGMYLAAGKVRGVRLDLLALNQNHEPPSLEAALQTYSALLLPAQNLDAALERLLPLILDPTFGQKLDASAQQKAAGPPTDQMMADEDLDFPDEEPEEAMQGTDAEALAQVVGIILGAPEFQRR